MDKKIHINDGRVEFECAWLLDLITCHQPIIFSPHLAKIDDMAKWVKELIKLNEVQVFHIVMKILSYFQFPQVSQDWSMYKKMKAYGDQFYVDNE